MRTLRAECPQHGLVALVWQEDCLWFACPECLDEHQQGVPGAVVRVVTDEQLAQSPDGGEPRAWPSWA